MATLQDFYPWIRLDCPSVPDPAVDDAIRKGAREFCKLTHAIEGQAVLTSVVGQRDYVPTLPDDTEIAEVRYVRRADNSSLTGFSLDFLDAQAPSSGNPNRYAVVETLPLSVRLYPTPDSEQTYQTQLVLIPTQDATEFDDKLLDWYQEGVTAYAKYYLMSQPGKPWSNAEQAAFEFRRFNTRVGDARIRRSQWRSGIPNSVTMHPFA